MKRATIATGAALGATGLFAPGAEAATITVDTLADDGGTLEETTLREAIDRANSTEVDDTIVFEAGLTGEIRLTGGALKVYMDSSGPYNAGDLEIQGPGASALTISGDRTGDGEVNDGDYRIIESYTDYAEAHNTELSISGLTLSGGYAGEYAGPGTYTCTDGYEGPPPDYYYYCTDGYYEYDDYYGTNGGAIQIYGGSLALTGVVLTDNFASEDGGAVSFYGQALTLNNTTIAGNLANDGGGGLDGYAEDTSITGSNISGNATTGYDFHYEEVRRAGSNGLSLASDNFSMTNTVVANNITTSPDGNYSPAMSVYGYTTDSAVSVIGSTIAGNEGGGLGLYISGSGSGLVERTVIAGNESSGGTAGAVVGHTTISLSRIENNTSTGFGTGGVNAYGDTTITRSTISGNSGRSGGLATFDDQDELAVDPTNVVKVINSTISGNAANNHGGGVYAQGENGISIRNSTIVNNSAETSGGGVFSYAGEDYTDYYPGDSEYYTPLNRKVSSTIIANNTAAGAPNDLATEGDNPTIGFSLENSLVETPGAARLAPAPVASIFGTDPQLGPLVNNGGVNRTHLPAGTSPVIDKGKANGLTVDQRGAVRTVDLSPANASDGTDIGAVEATTGPPPPDEEVDVEVTVDKSQKFKGKKLKLKIEVACEEPCTATADGTVSVGGGGKGRILFKAKKYKLKAAGAELGAGESTTLVLKLDGNKKKAKKAGKKIKKAVKKGKKVTAKVTVDITDEAGNTEGTDSTIKIK